MAISKKNRPEAALSVLKNPSRGERHRSFGEWLLGVPEIGTPDPKTEKAIFEAMLAARPRQLQNVQVHTGYENPDTFLERLKGNKAEFELDRISPDIGELSEMQLRELADSSPYYRPNTNNVVTNWNAPGATVHELGHAIDFNENAPSDPGQEYDALDKLTRNYVYPLIPGNQLYAEHAAWDKGEQAFIEGAAKTKLEQQKALEVAESAGDLRPPALGSYWGSTLGGGAGFLGGGALGLMLAAQMAQDGGSVPGAVIIGPALLGGALGGLGGAVGGSSLSRWLWSDSYKKQLKERLLTAYQKAKLHGDKLQKSDVPVYGDRGKKMTLGKSKNEKRKVANGRCWSGYEPTPGKAPYSDDSCRPVDSKKPEKKRQAPKTAEAKLYPLSPQQEAIAIPPSVGYTYNTMSRPKNYGAAYRSVSAEHPWRAPATTRPLELSAGQQIRKRLPVRLDPNFGVIANMPQQFVSQEVMPVPSDASRFIKLLPGMPPAATPAVETPIKSPARRKPLQRTSTQKTAKTELSRILFTALMVTPSKKLANEAVSALSPANVEQAPVSALLPGNVQQPPVSATSPANVRTLVKVPPAPNSPYTPAETTSPVSALLPDNVQQPSKPRASGPAEPHPLARYMNTPQNKAVAAGRAFAPFAAEAGFGEKPQSSFYDQMMGYAPYALGAGGIGLAGLLAYNMLNSRRRRDDDEDR